jgi:tryptophan synthase alpha chain
MTGTEAIAAAFTGDGRRAALMPYMMGGFPDMETSRRIAEAYADGGADLVELGIPFTDPLADGPVIQAAGTAALRAGATTHEVLAVGRALADRPPTTSRWSRWPMRTSSSPAGWSASSTSSSATGSPG